MFKTEQDMVTAFKSVSKVFLSDFFERRINRYFLIEEFNSTYGVADLVIGTYNPYLSKKMARKCIDLNWVAPLSSFEKNKEISVTDFMDTFGVSRPTALKKLRNYTDAKFAKPIGPHLYKITKAYKTITETVVSIEAKLKNWKRALLQANRYKKFSNYSFVLLNQQYARPALSNIHKFKELNIGLMTMDEIGYTLHYSPGRMNQSKSQYYLMVNEAAYCAFTEQFSVC